MSGRHDVWARSLWLLNIGWRDAAAEQLRRSFGFRTASPARDSDRASLGRLAIQLVRGGTPGREILRLLDEANERQANPISAQEIGEIATWALEVSRNRNAPQ